MAVYSGSLGLQGVYLGSTPVQKIYLGTTEIWSGASPVQFLDANATGVNSVPIPTHAIGELIVLCAVNDYATQASGKTLCGGNRAELGVHRQHRRHGCHYLLFQGDGYEPHIWDVDEHKPHDRGSTARTERGYPYRRACVPTWYLKRAVHSPGYHVGPHRWIVGAVVLPRPHHPKQHRMGRSPNRLHPPRRVWHRVPAGLATQYEERHNLRWLSVTNRWTELQ